MRALLRKDSGSGPAFFYLSQTGARLRYGEFFEELPANVSLEEETFDSLDLAMDAYTQHVTERVNRGFVTTTLTQELHSQLEGGSSVEDSVFIRLPTIETTSLALIHDQLAPILGVWKDRGVGLDTWEGVLAFRVQGRRFAVRSTDEEGDNAPRQAGSQCIRCEGPTTLLRTTDLERYVLRIVLALMARRFDAVEMMVGDGKMIRPRRVGTPLTDTVGLSNDGIDQLVARLREAKLLGPSTLLTNPVTDGRQHQSASPLAF